MYTWCSVRIVARHLDHAGHVEILFSARELFDSTSDIYSLHAASISGFYASLCGIRCRVCHTGLPLKTLSLGLLMNRFAINSTRTLTKATQVVYITPRAISAHTRLVQRLVCSPGRVR